MPDIKLSSSEVNEICELLNTAEKIVLEENIKDYRKNRILILLNKAGHIASRAVICQ